MSQLRRVPEIKLEKEAAPDERFSRSTGLMRPREIGAFFVLARLMCGMVKFTRRSAALGNQGRFAFSADGN